MNVKIKLSILILLLIFQSQLYAAEEKFAAGYQGTFPATGISGKMKISNVITAQAMIGFWGTLNTYAARGLYRFQEDKFWNAYGYGMLGFWSYRATVYDFSTFSNQEKTQFVLGFGGGAGIEYNWQAVAPDLPPIWFNLELGFGSIKFNDLNYNVSGVLIGGGAHYRFDL
ncbi:MAG: hypothetical protein OEZ58_14545 [Gammaproteobacteria bacterium]|nr:hypothetical protein [Gammaproteobacteria bacterium]MDH5730212.1 hypothetical protein [Gammaproteobacteria bacterium]